MLYGCCAGILAVNIERVEAAPAAEAQTPVALAGAHLRYNDDLSLALYHADFP